MLSTTKNNPQAGILPRALTDLFDALAAQAASDDNYSYNVTLQYLEVYGDEIRDLFRAAGSGNQKLTVREFHDEPEVPDAVTVTCTSAADAAQAIARGSLRRVTAATAMNATSSRSHALLTVALTQQWESGDGSNMTDDAPPQTVVTKNSKFHFCDLAGSERQKRTQAAGQRLKEGIHINQGLLVLGNVISALASNSSHVPYRDSKLTRLLRGSLGGNHQTLMMACVSPASSNVDESLNCLRYANRAKNIQNSAIVNLDAHSRRLLELQQHIVGLAQALWLVVSAGEKNSGGDNGNDKQSLSQQPDWPSILSQIPYSRADLEALVAGGNAQVRGIDKSSSPGPRTPPTTRAPLDGLTPASNRRDIHNTSMTTLRSPTHREDYRLREMEGRVRALEKELIHTQKRLQESQDFHDAAEVELHRYRALEKLGSLSSDDNPDDKENTAAHSFLEQATAYEQEISYLRKELQKSERRANRLALWQNVDPREEESRLQAAEASLQQDQLRLRQLQSAMESEGSPEKTRTAAAMSSTDALDEEERAEQADLQKWTQKYLAQGGHVDEEEPEEQHGKLLEQIAVDLGAVSDEMSIEMKHLHMENDLVALSKSIEERENLIRELKENQEKFASMREFYEEKLSKMESELREKEQEREELAQQLETAKTRGSTQELQSRLREKDHYIDNLRRKQKELRNLTNVSHRNELDIARLQNDVLEMKRKRVSMQKELAAERKQHAKEVKEWQRTATQKEREITKLQKISNQRELQAKKAGQVAKARLEELNVLRAKNKEVEKKLRMQSVKKGMMQKAGIDSVLVGQRARRTNADPFGSSVAVNSTDIDVESLQVLFDKKISEVVRKEALADKLAEEWEEHYDLTNRRQELLVSEDQEAEEELQAVSLQIRYKQNRIRQLAKKLGKQGVNGSKQADGDFELFDTEFHKLCRGKCLLRRFN